MYVDQKQKDLIADTKDKDGNLIKDIHAMDYNEALAITGSTNKTNEMRNIGAHYWLASANPDNNPSNDHYVSFVSYYGTIYHEFSTCFGVRPVITMADGVYIKSGTGTDSDPYILGKD